MGRTAKPLDPTLSMSHFFGAELRRRRELNGWSQQDLADGIVHGVDLVRKVEAAERHPSMALVRAADEVLGASGALLRLLPFLERERALGSGGGGGRRGAGDALAMGDAEVLDWLLDPGTDGRDDLGGRVGDEDEALLDRLRAADRSAGAGRIHDQLVAWVDHVDDVAAQSPRLAVGYLELAGYQSVDLGADGRARQYYLHALRIARTYGDRRYGGYLVGVSLAHLALHGGDATRAQRYATAALCGTRALATPAMRAAFHAVTARARARLGDETGCTAALADCEAALAHSAATEEPAWMRYFGEADLADEKAHCFLDLGRDITAQREASTAVALLDPSRVRRMAIDTAVQASALARSGEIDEACAVGRTAVAHATGTASFRSTQRIVQMLAQLQPHAGQAVVRDLIDEAAALAVPPAVIGARC